MEASELKRLIKSANKGDEDAFAELTRWAIGQRSEPESGSPPEPVAPIVAETLCNAVRAVEEAGRPPRSRWFTWLHQLVARCLQSRGTSGTADTSTLYQHHEEGPLSDSSSQVLQDAGCEEDASSEAILRAELVRLIHESLRALPPPDRVLLELRYWMGCSMPELARRLDCTEAEAARRLRLAVGAFRREMVREGETREYDR